jgi:DNA primase
MIPDTVLDDLRARLPVSAVVGKFVKLTRAGCEWKARSPFRKERTPSFCVNDQKGFYHDFGSGAHGDIFEFLMKMEGLDFPQAVKRCTEMAGGVESKAASPAPSTSQVEEQAIQLRKARWLWSRRNRISWLQCHQPSYAVPPPSPAS